MKPRSESAFVGSKRRRAGRNNRPEGRSIPLNAAQQEHILRCVISWRIQTIEACIRDKDGAFSKRTAAALLSRAIAGFLGIRLGKEGKDLARDDEYHAHKDGCSWEVKIVDIAGGSFVDLDRLTQGDRRVLREGIAEANQAFAHITYWSDPGNQKPDGAPTSDCATEQWTKLQAFAKVVIRLFEEKAEAVRIARGVGP